VIAADSEALRRMRLGEETGPDSVNQTVDFSGSAVVLDCPDWTEDVVPSTGIARFDREDAHCHTAGVAEGSAYPKRDALVSRVLGEPDVAPLGTCRKKEGSD